MWPLIRRGAALNYPVLPAPPTAVLDPRFRSRGAIRVVEDLGEFRPASIAASWPRLQPLLDRKIDCLTHAVIVLADSVDTLLTAEQRDRIWRTFRVPVFEQIVGPRGQLLAAECEAHAGLHLVKLDAGSREIETARCACGLGTPRIRSAGQAADARTVVAYAR